MKYIINLLILFSLFYSKNLSAFYEVSIKNNNPQLTKDHYSNIILDKLTNSNFDSQEINGFITNFFYNNVKKEYNFQVNLRGLEDKINFEGYPFNLSLLNCTLKENFFQLSFVDEDNCPSFQMISKNQNNYIYVKSEDTFFRIINFNKKEDLSLSDLWITFLPTNKNFMRKFKTTNQNYLKLTKILDYYPIIKSSEKGFIETEFDHYYSNNQINFLLNFL